MPFEILFHPNSVGFLKKLDGGAKEAIKKKIAELRSYPERGKHLRYVPFFGAYVSEIAGSSTK
jgi:mRNA-degrading endonuclease RelE of RelBE toxin-antitoxin system